MFSVYFHTVCMRLMDTFSRNPMMSGIIAGLAFFATCTLLPPLLSSMMPEWLTLVVVLFAWLPVGVVVLIVAWKKILKG